MAQKAAKIARERIKWEGTNTGLDYWTEILEWTTGLTYFWFSHIFGRLIQILRLKCLTDDV